MKNQFDSRRRDFCKTGLAGLAGFSLLPAGRNGLSLEDPVPAKDRPAMIYRTLGRTGLKLPVVSMGVMNADNPNLVKAALEAGIVHLDTAHGYQRGRNEEMIGQVIKGLPRQSYVIATKVRGEGMDRETGLFTEKSTAAALTEQFNLSLQRLGLEYVDILYLHNVFRREAVLFEPLLAALEQLKKDGKVRFIGVSTHRNEPEVIRAAIEGKKHDVVLTAYNFRQDHHTEVAKAISEAAAAGLGIVAMKTQAGVYWDKEKTKPINMTAALKWTLQHPGVHTTIPGFTTYDQMNLDLSVMKGLNLTAEEKSSLQAPAAQAGLFCQQCGACTAQCSRRLPIPDLMRGYMYAAAYRNLDAAREMAIETGVPENPCAGCGDCPVRCVKGMDVRERLTAIAALHHLPADFLV